ncbi:FAD-dependent oxidoreductase [Rhodobacter sp. CZR27]|uniref:FAD-dependent oxidoreductase n=1 Tax=Rhodobacter sp. CZR27 TaxID=2033869 RepID=UPI000BBF35DA|nr:FAD-dependent oxidoreductase [Rhodobacter sp. CZR27]
MSRGGAVDCLVIGGGFYGCCLALFLRSVTDRIVLVESGDRLMDRASRVNQARVHTGFHYPRSALTAAKSMVLHRRFAEDFPEAIRSDFQMLYAIARRRSKVSAKRFYRMFSDMGAPIAPATPSQAALFDPATIEATFACTEHAFDYSVLRNHMGRRLDALGMDLRLNTAVEGLEEHEDGVIVRLSSGEEIRARHVFNVTYAQINHILRMAALPEASLKHELTEIALIRPPAQLEGFGITIMDGPFLSVMPYPAEALHSLTHVRYTPQMSWTDATSDRPAYEVFAAAEPQSRHRHMILDGLRYVPCLAESQWVRSIHDVKTVLVKNEQDDGRPILYQQQPRGSRVISILGGKIDNIYDLFDLVRLTRPDWAAANESLLCPPRAARRMA